MEDEAVRARLEAAAAAATCDDGDAAQQALAVDAITAAIASCLEEDPSSSVVPAIAQFVRESPMSVAIVQQLIYTRTSCDDLLDALLPVVIEMHEAQEGADGRLELLTSFFALALRQVQSPEQSDAGMAMALVWSERVLEVIYTLEVQTALEREVVRQVVTLLVKIESALPPEAEFKVLTLAWKHLTKLSQSFHQVLVEATHEPNGEAAAAAISTSVDSAALLARVTRCFEQWALRLHATVCSESEQAVIADLVRSLKIMRLYWRAFQGLFRSFASAHVSEVENCVLGLVHSTALLEATIVKATQMCLPAKCIVELSRQLTMQLGFAEKLPTDEAVAADTIAIVRALLDHPLADMERALSERQSLLVNEASAPNTSLPNEVRWVHLLMHTGLAVSYDGDQGHESVDDSPAAVATKVLVKYRECALLGCINHNVPSFDHFIDFMIGFLLKMNDHMGFLIQQTFHPDVAQRILLWRIWNECMTNCWSEAQASANLQALFDCVLWEGNSTIMTIGVRRDIMDLVAFLYLDMGEVLKRKCLDIVTAMIDLICRDGPTHAFSLTTAAQIELLDVLASAKFLVDYDHPEKEDWIQHYLPMSLECCGTILDLLSKSSLPSTRIQIDEFYGRVRVLDVSLLVIRAVFDDNEPREAELGELMLIVVPLCTEALTQISKLRNFTIPQTPSVRSNTTMRSLHRPKSSPQSKEQPDALLLDSESRRSCNRVLETTLYLLAKVGPALKQNRNNECAQVVKDLTNIVNARNDLNVAVACFVESTLFDVEVAECDEEVMWQLFSQLFRRLLTPSIKGLEPSYSEIVCFDAFLAFLMNASLIESKSQHVAEVLDAATNIRFMKYVALRKLDPAHRTFGNLQAYRDLWAQNMHQSLVLRFPEQADAPKPGRKRVHELIDEEQQYSVDVSEPPKRQKLDRLVSLLGTVYNKLRNLPPNSNTMLTDDDFENATSFVEYLTSRIS